MIFPLHLKLTSEKDSETQYGVIFRYLLLMAGNFTVEIAIAIPLTTGGFQVFNDFDLVSDCQPQLEQARHADLNDLCDWPAGSDVSVIQSLYYTFEYTSPKPISTSTPSHVLNAIRAQRQEILNTISRYTELLEEHGLDPDDENYNLK